MTARLNARLEPALERKLDYLKARTGLSTTELVRLSLEHYYSLLVAEERPALLALRDSGFIGSGVGPADLSTNYKADLTSLLTRKA